MEKVRGICREMILLFKFSRANLAEWLRRQFQVLVVTGKGSNPLVRRSFCWWIHDENPPLSSQILPFCGFKFCRQVGMIGRKFAFFRYK